MSIEKNIFLTTKLNFNQKIRRYFDYSIAKYKAKRNFTKMYRMVYSKVPSYKKRDFNEREKKHIDYWKDFRGTVDLSTYRISNNISKVADIRYVPEEIYITDIEPTLNNYPFVKFLEVKNFYNKWFDEDVFPKNYFHKIDGEYFSDDLRSFKIVELNNIIDNLQYPVVCKQSVYSYGGRDVKFAKDKTQLLRFINAKQNVVVQEKLNPNEGFLKFSPVNTVRVCLYKSVTTNEIHILHMALRMGRNGSLDNEGSGGIVSFINDEGLLHGYAVDKYGRKFDKHPDTGSLFNSKIPDLDRLINVSKKVCEKIPFARIISLDAWYDAKNNWRIIEVNLFGQTIRFAQYAGRPFFGVFTDEVKEFSSNHHWAFA